jgi:hypothetical protein
MGKSSCERILLSLFYMKLEQSGIIFIEKLCFFIKRDDSEESLCGWIVGTYDENSPGNELPGEWNVLFANCGIGQHCP